jgi:hypothetical protein
MGARPRLARTQYDCARMLLVRERRGDREQALKLLEHAAQTARTLGLGLLERDIERTLGGELPAADSDRAISGSAAGQKPPQHVAMSATATSEGGCSNKHVAMSATATAGGDALYTEREARSQRWMAPCYACARGAQRSTGAPFTTVAPPPQISGSSSC